MPDFSRLPTRPSLEQLQKQARELLRDYRASVPSAVARFRGAEASTVTLADSQFVLAREYGFDNWAALKHRIEALRSSGLDPYDRMAKDVAAAYTAGDMHAIREINWNYGTSFVWDREPEKMKQRLTRWFASEARTSELALEDARQLVARSYGVESWEKFVESITNPIYDMDADNEKISLRGPRSEQHWDAICAVAKEHRLTRLQAGGITNVGMERITRVESLTSLELGNSNRLTDEGLSLLARLPQLEELDLGGVNGVVTDRGLEVLKGLPKLRKVFLYWQPHVSDAGAAHLASCEQLEVVDLMGTATGDGAIRALADKSKLSRFKTGRNVTDSGLALLHCFPIFKTWHGGEPQYGLLSPHASPNHLLVDGPFTNAGIASLVGLDGMFGLSFFWHCSGFTSEGLEPLKYLPNLGMLGCEGKRCDDEAMRHIAAIPRLRMLMAQDTVASDAGFAQLSKSESIEYLWGRKCPNLTGRGIAALAAMPALRGIAVSCKNVNDEALSMLPRFPALKEITPIGISDEGFRHVGRCEQLERLTCMYCRDTGDVATAYIEGLTNLKSYYAGETQITDRSLEILGRMQSLEKLQFWNCSRLTDAGFAHLTRLPRLREVILDGLSGVTRGVVGLFPAHVRVTYSG